MKLEASMQMNALAWLFLATTLICAGCGQRGTDKPTDRAPRSASTDSRADATTGPSAFASRLGAAKAIGDVITRDAALSKLATDAAAGGDGEIAIKALEAILDSVTKNDVAGRTALTLAKGGKGDEANTVARLIGDSVARDNVLAKIAKGELSE